MAGIVLAPACYLGFKMDPVHTWKISVSILTLLYVYSCVSYILHVVDDPDRLDLWGMLVVIAGLCCMVAFVEIAMSHARRRGVNAVLAGTALTACTLLSFVMFARVIPDLFHSLSDLIVGSVRLVLLMGPLCCITAATWVGRKSLGNSGMITDGADR